MVKPWWTFVWCRSHSRPEFSSEVEQPGPISPYGTQGSEQSFEFGLERLLDGIGVLILNPSR
jgi:hypothetical protein